MFSRTFSPAVKPLAAVLGAALLLGACSHMPADSSAQSSKPASQLAADWREHARPLLYHGMGREPGYTIWMVPTILPKGAYRVIERHSAPDGNPAEDTAELLDGYRFEIGSAAWEDIYLPIWSSYNNVEALDERYILGLDGRTNYH